MHDQARHRLPERGGHVRDRVAIRVWARDPISYARVASQLRSRPEITLLESDEEPATVAVVVADTVGDDTIQMLRSVQRGSCRSVLVVAHIDDAGLATAVEAGVAGLVRRAEATPERLVKAAP